MIELRQFRQFIAVAEELSFRRAAARLNMAQPPLTASIRRIEEEIGGQLMERTNRVTRLTEAGQLFLEEARRTVAQADRTITSAKRAAAGLSGSLRVSFVASAAREILPAILLHFREYHPDVHLELREAMTGPQTEALRNFEIDLGFLVPPLPDMDKLHLEIIHADRLIAAVPERHRLAQRETIELTDLASEPWISYPAHRGPGLYQRTIAACLSAGFTPTVTQEVLQMDTIVSLVAGGIGVALVPPTLSNSGRRGVVFRELSGAGSPVKYELAIAYRQSTPVLGAFIRSIHATRDRR
jgi:DNA-binding transcriptional LysR family regulator